MSGFFDDMDAANTERRRKREDSPPVMVGVSAVDGVVTVAIEDVGEIQTPTGEGAAEYVLRHAREALDELADYNVRRLLVR